MISGTFILIHNELDQLHAQLESDMATVEVGDSDDFALLVSHDISQSALSLHEVENSSLVIECHKLSFPPKCFPDKFILTMKIL